MDEPAFVTLMAWALRILPVYYCTLCSILKIFFGHFFYPTAFETGPESNVGLVLLKVNDRAKSGLRQSRTLRGRPPRRDGGRSFDATGFGFAEPVHCPEPVYWLELRGPGPAV